ncbi:unnamed protein product [Adineta steineri]|uniref:Uncharacterized protein n=1 Tax=Adineta steineri TaxID=433720 RepID=A0A818II16_9BILA|nr:unnamed protein product [Adineta steineri]CAF3525271.1 unnamed protein product [Adineta steineri]
MRQQYGIFCLLVLFITGYQAQETSTLNPDWHGDPLLCTNNPVPTSAPGPIPPVPQFPRRAEFALERVEAKRILNITLPDQVTMYEYLYDYDANSLIMVKNANGFIDVEYFYYHILKKSTYIARQYCNVSDIPTNQEMDGASAVQTAAGWHIRPLNEFFLFASDDPNRRITPIYLGQDIVRGIPVDKWQTCIVDKPNYRTVRRIWTFAQRGVQTPVGVVGELAYPVQAIISASVDFPNGTQALEVDEVFNVLSYKPYIVETSVQLAPPKGVFCKTGEGQDLISLSDAHISWSNRFSVRVEASTSLSVQRQGFHIRYDSGRDGSSRRLRYDWQPPGSEDYQSVIHDYGNELTYTIDRRVGSCKIDAGTNIDDVNPGSNPIAFFIKNEAMFLYSPPEKAWEFNGLRACRGNAIVCTVLTMQKDSFPPMVESDLGEPTGENWGATNIEYAWSMRSPFSRPMFNRSKQFDYPVSLYLRLFRLNNPEAGFSPQNIRTENIEYEFYEMNHERHPQDFDVSICYRSLNYEYLHLVFTLNVNRGDVIDGNHIDRRELEGYVHFTLMNHTGVQYSRITDLEIDHERVSNDVTVFFTLLGRTPKPGSPSGFADEITAQEGHDRLRTAINNGQYTFSFRMRNNSTVQFNAATNSLKSSKHYVSTHSAGRRNTVETYSSGAQALAIILGLIIGIVVGAIIAAVVRIVRKEPMPDMPTSIRNPLPSINFHSKKSSPAAASTSNA